MKCGLHVPNNITGNYDSPEVNIMYSLIKISVDEVKQGNLEEKKRALKFLNSKQGQLCAELCRFNVDTYVDLVATLEKKHLIIDHST